MEPEIEERISLDGKIYTFTEAPNAPGILYAEIGRKARVYRVTSAGHFFALKTFKARYRSAQTVENTGRIAAFQDVPGLSVARRTILDPEKYKDIIQAHEDFAYAVLMPWAEGRSWFNYVTGKVTLTRQESLHLARALANAMRELEQRDLAHCDLSSSNFIFSPDFKHVELIDIEDMFGHGLIMPSDKPRGTGGYAPDWVKKDGIWEAGADRFSTGILLSEILAWQFDDIRAESAGDAFFAEGEFGHKSKRFRMMSDRLEQVHPELSRLFKTVWYAESVEECPRIADWKNVLDSIKEPELKVTPEFLEFGVLDLSVKSAIRPQITLKVKNAGVGILNGRVLPNVPWLSVAPVVFSCPEGAESKHLVKLNFKAPLSKKQKNYKFNSGITIYSNAGDKPLSGSYSFLPPKTQVSKWVYIVITAIFLLGIVGAMITGINHFTSRISSTAIPISHVSSLPLSTSTVITPATQAPIESVTRYQDDFSSYSLSEPPMGWLLRGEQSITPIIIDVGGTGSQYRVVDFPEVPWEYWDKWLLKDSLVLSGSYSVTVKINFQNEVADRAGITIAWNDSSWDRIDIQANVYNDNIEFRPTYTGPITSSPSVETLGSISVSAGYDYWLRVVAVDNGPGQGEVKVFWSTDGFSYSPVLVARGLANLTGLVGISTAGPHMPSAYFDDFYIMNNNGE